MKKWIGLFILIILLTIAGGCTTQQAKPPATAQPVTEATAAAVTTPVPDTAVMTAAKTTIPQTVTVMETAAAATPAPSTTFSGTNVIHIKDNTFVPDELTVLPGTGITWINDDPAVHIVRAAGESAGKFTSSELINGASFHYTFGEKTGTYEFEDPRYPGMNGTIIIRKGESVVGASTLISQGSS